MPEPNSHAHVAYTRAPITESKDAPGNVSINNNNNQDLNPVVMTPSRHSTISVGRTLFIGLCILLVILLLLLVALPAITYCLTRAGIDQLDDHLYELELPPQMRLSERLAPELYELTLKTYLPSKSVQFTDDKLFKFDANLTITIRCVRRMRHVQLHALYLQFDESTFRLKDSSSGESYSLVKTHLYMADKIRQQVVFELDRHLTPGNTYEMYIEYVGEISNNLNGMYRIKYDEEGEEKWLATTQFQPTYARALMPCFDEPEMKAKFDVTVIHPADMNALSNSMEDQKKLIGDGWMRTSYHRTPKMSSYLLAIVISQFEHADKTTKSGTMFRVWSRPSMKESCGFAAEIGVKILEFFEEFFGLHFPLEKQDMVAMPDFDAGAMENWGLIMFRDMFLLYSQLSSATKTKARVAEIVAHELAHQWFGNLVTMEWWDELWLNEGFATYLQYLGTDKGLDVDSMQTFATKTIQNAMNLDQMLSSHPLKVTTADSEAIFQVFDRITYDKGASIVKMLGAIVGTDVLHESIKIYLRDNQYGNANIDYLLNLIGHLMPKMNSTSTYMEPNTPLDLNKIMKCWIRRAGFPLVTVVRNYDTNEFTLSQTKGRFLSGTGHKEPLEDPHNTPAECANGWFIPVFYRTANKRNFVWLTPDEPTITVPLGDDRESWLLVNDDVKALFRATYDERNWLKIIDLLNTNRTEFNSNIRSQLLDDAFTLANAGHLNYTVVMKLSTYLQYEDHSSPWESIEKVLTTWEILLRSTYPDHFRTYLRWLINKLFVMMQMPKYDHLGDDVFHHVDKNIREAVYCAGVWQGDDEDWQFMWQKYQEEIKNPAEKFTLLYGVSCTQNMTKINGLLSELTSFKTVRLSEAGLLIELLAQNPKIGKTLWTYISGHWEDIRAVVGESSSLQLMLSASTHGFSTEQDVKNLEVFVETHDLGIASQIGKIAIETSKISMDWVRQYGVVVDAWAKQFNADNGIS